MTQNQHIYTICCRPAVDDDAISGWNFKTPEGCLVVNLEVASSSSFWDFLKRLFCDGDVGDGGSGVNAICSRPEVADDVISGEDAENFKEYVFCSLSSLRENRNQPFRLCNGKTFEPHFRARQGAKMSNKLHKRKWDTCISLSKTVNLWKIYLNRYREIATRIWLKLNTFMRLAVDWK